MIFKIKIDVKGYPYWVLVAANGEPICWSESYQAIAGVNHSISLVKAGAFAAQIVDER